MTTKPFIIKHNGITKIVVAFSDIDGTINNQMLPESKRIRSILPAKEAFYLLEQMGINVGVATGRSIEEAFLYQDLLQTHGLAICEDGSVISTNYNKLIDGFENVAKNNKVYQTLYKDKLSLIIGNHNKTTLEHFIKYIKNEFDLLLPADNHELISSISSPCDIIKKVFKHSSLKSAKMSANRLASLYYAENHLSCQQNKIIMDNIGKNGIRSFGSPAHLVSASTNKGIALKFLNDNAKILYPKTLYGKTISGIIPIVFGNHKNDIELLNTACDIGGMAILVAHPNPDTKYYIDTSLISPEIIKTRLPYGYGIKEAIPKIEKLLSNL